MALRTSMEKVQTSGRVSGYWPLKRSPLLLNVAGVLRKETKVEYICGLSGCEHLWRCHSQHTTSVSAALLPQFHAVPTIPSKPVRMDFTLSLHYVGCYASCYLLAPVSISLVVLKPAG